jgi:hypothetical protein
MVTLLGSSGIKPHFKDHNTNIMTVEEVRKVRRQIGVHRMLGT